MTTPENVRAALMALVEAVEEDEARHVGTLSLTTLQKASLDQRGPRQRRAANPAARSLRAGQKSRAPEHSPAAAVGQPHGF